MLAGSVASPPSTTSTQPYSFTKQPVCPHFGMVSLSENAGRPVDKNYLRTLARYGKIKSLDIGARGKLYWRADVDGYIVDTKRGRKAVSKQEAVSS